MKVYGGYYHGRVLDLPEGTREGDIACLPETLPAGETFNSGRTRPEEHAHERTYVVRETAVGGTLYLAVTQRPRLIRQVNVPPVPTIPVTVHLSL